MNFRLNRPDMLAQAQKNQKGWNVFLEILLFIGLFLITQIVLGLLIGIPIGAYSMMLGFQSSASNTALNLEQLQSKIMLFAMISQLYAELICIFLLLGLCKWIQKRKAWTLGFKKPSWFKEYAAGMGIGFGMMALAVIVGLIFGAIRLNINEDIYSLKNWGLLLIIFVGFLFQGMFEEVLCRGYFLISLSRKKGNVWMGIIVSSLAFSALHLANPGISVLPIVNLTLFGIFAGVYFIKRGNLWGIGALHSLWNFTQGNVFGVLVSGNDFGTSLMVTEVNPNMTLLNGGSFGLEGGLIVTVILVVGTLLLLKLPQKDTAVEEPVLSQEASAE